MSISKAYSLVCYLYLLTFVFHVFAESSSHYGPSPEHHKKSKESRMNRNPSIISPPSPSSPSSSSSGYNQQGSNNIFNVLSFGAKGDGVTDDSQAFLAAWQQACRVESACLEVPQGFKFLVCPITFPGPCQPDFVFKIEGTILAPSIADPWSSKPLQWLNFHQLDSFSISGSGVVDGQGAVWWDDNNNMPSTEPTALRFYGGTDLTVQGISIVNSPQCHLKFDACNFVQVTGITISSPGDSPNTDGIHLQNSRNVEIQQSTIGCGDDCISIQTGCSAINIHNIHCGPSHGISIGGLGPGHSKACVSNINVHDMDIDSSTTGARIKTWPGGLGSVKDVTFQNIRVTNVDMPIVIDQFYCGGSSSCSTGGSAVAISGVSFEQIRGTYTGMPIHIACSDVVPCQGLSFSDVKLYPALNAKAIPLCMNTYPSTTLTTPPLHCYIRGAHGSATYNDQDVASDC